MKHTVLFLFVIISFQLTAQNNWLKNFGSTQIDYADKVITDSLNNVFISGRMRTNMTIGDTTLLKIGANPYNYFLAKFTESGQFVWALNVDVAPSTDPVGGLEVDRNQNIYMTLERPGTLYKISTNGIVLIKKTINAQNARLSNVQIDKNLNIWVGGSFSQSNFSLDGLPAMPHLGGTGMFVARLDSNLTAKLVIPIGSNSLSSRVGRIALKDSLIYVVTNSDNSVYIKNDTIKDARIITTCFDITGKLNWYKAIYPTGLLGGEQIWDIAVSDSNQVVIIGEYFRPIKIENIVLSNDNEKDNFFIVSYNKNGNLLWAKKSNTIYSLGKAVKFTKEGKIAVIGNYNFSFSFGNSSIGDGISNKSYPFLMELDNNGNTEWIKNLGQSDWAYAIDLAIDKKGNWYLGGQYQATTTNVIDGKSLTVVGESDVYLLKNFMVNEPTVGNTTFCNDNLPKSLTATGTNVNWFADSLATVLVFKGNNLTINLINDSVFYVQQSFGTVFSKPKAVLVKINQLKPFKLTQSGNTITVQPAIGKNYQWFTNNSLITGVNRPSFVASINGKYNVIVIDSNNCRNYTDTLNFVSNSLNEMFTNQVNIFPNPNNGNFTMEFLKEGNYQIVNQLGQVINHFDIQKSENDKLMINNLESGLYFILFTTKQGSFSQKIIVLKTN